MKAHLKTNTKHASCQSLLRRASMFCESLRSVSLAGGRKANNSNLSLYSVPGRAFAYTSQVDVQEPAGHAAFAVLEPFADI